MTDQTAPARPKSLLADILLEVRWYALAIAAAGAAVAAIFKWGGEQLVNYGFTQPQTLLVAGTTVLFIAVGIARPLWRERRRRERLIKVAEGDFQELSDYFRLAPRQATDHDKFQRGDLAHRKVLTWIIDAEHPLLFLTGRSGVGKSSLLSAYVIPELEQRDPPFVVVEARGFADPLGALTSALSKPGAIWEKRPRAIDGPRDLVERAAKHIAPSRLLIVLDQFEEFIILNNEDQQRSMRDFLLDLEKSPVDRAQVLLSARSDREYLAELQVLGLGRMTLDENWFVIDGFETSEAREFFQRAGLEIPERLLSAVLKEAHEIEEGGTRVRPIVLNLLGMVLKRHAGGELTGAAEGAIARHFLETALSRADTRDDAPALLNRMITDAGTKRPIDEKALAESTGIAQGVVRGCLSMLSRDGLVREIDRDGHIWEIAHDFVARMLGQILGRLRPPRMQAILRAVGPLAVGLWLIAALGAWPIYLDSHFPEVRSELFTPVAARSLDFSVAGSNVSHAYLTDPTGVERDLVIPENRLVEDTLTGLEEGPNAFSLRLVAGWFSEERVIPLTVTYYPRWEIRQFPASRHTNAVRATAFSPDGKTLASASEDDTLKLWDVAAGVEIRSLAGHAGSVYGVAFSPDGKTLASASSDDTLKLWDVAAGVEIRSLAGHAGGVQGVAFSPDGKTLASASWDNTLKLWDVATGVEIRSLAGHTGSVVGVAFSPDGKTLASASNDDTLKLWWALRQPRL